MNDVELERRLRRWMTEREPGTVPASVRGVAAAVSEGTPVPVRWRLQGAVVRDRTSWSVGPVAALVALILLVVATLVAALVASRPPGPLPGLDRWGAFAVGEPAPRIAWREAGGSGSVDAGKTVEFEDLAGSVVVILVPDARPDAAASQRSALASARDQVGDGAKFLVATRSADAVDAIARSGLGVMDLSDAGHAAAFPAERPALVVVDRRGLVARLYAGALPTTPELVKLVHELEATR